MQQEILLLEPNYNAKYPPIGLMKIAYFHRVLRQDNVQFAKGTLPVGFSPRKWDRIYVTSMFTYEFQATVEALRYAQTLVSDNRRIVFGGISASLMSDRYEAATGIHPVTGLLNIPGRIELPHDEIIDTLPLDYSILDQILPYKYTAHDAYFLSATKGCGMRCGFCAVQTLEPQYIEYIDIKDMVRTVDDMFGPKRDLLLMDNNVLKSRSFNRIIDDILELGFERGANYINPKTGKIVQRAVDFNQGLDANFLTPEKARRLGEIALKPARIAFDHIEDRDSYVRAIELCAEYGVTEMSNYLLYNSDSFTGKGQRYNADTPENLYTRMRVSFDLQSRLNEGRDAEHRISIFSFPMRYIPLNATERGYIGPDWSAKQLRAVQCMLIPTQGKGVGRQSFFEADFGACEAEFVENLLMPERLMTVRGHLVGRRQNESHDDFEVRRRLWEENDSHIREWKRLFRSLGEERKAFENVVQDNEFLPEKLLNLHSPLQQKLYLHYLTMNRVLKLVSIVRRNSPTRDMLMNYMKVEFPIFYRKLVRTMVETTPQQHYMIRSFLDFFGKEGLKDLFAALAVEDFSEDKLLGTWVNAMRLNKAPLFEFELVRLYRRYVELGCLDDAAHLVARKAILELRGEGLREVLKDHYEAFEAKVLEASGDDHGEEVLRRAAQSVLEHFQVTFFATDGEMTSPWTPS